MSISPRASSGAIDASTHASVAPTSAVPLDTAIVERMVGQRLRSVEVNLIREALMRAGQDADIDSKPTEDLLGSLSSLLLGLADARGRAQTLEASLIRSGLSFSIAELTLDANVGPLLNPSQCRAAQENRAAPSRQRQILFFANLAYEGLAASSLLRSFGFSQAQQQIDAPAERSTECRAYTEGIRDFIDGLGRLQGAINAAQAAVAANSTSGQIHAAMEVLGQRCQVSGNPSVTETSRSLSDAGTSATVWLAADPATQQSQYPGFWRQLTQLRVNRLQPDQGAAYAWEADCIRAIQTLISTGNPTTPIVAVAPAPAPVATAADAMNLIRNVDSNLNDHAQGVADQLNAPNLLPVREILNIVNALANAPNTNGVRRGDIIVVARWIRVAIGAALESHKSERGVAMFLSFLNELPNAIREDQSANGRYSIYVDPALLVNALATSFSNSDHGYYLRATVGMGYSYLPGATGLNPLQPVFYEELGFGRRCSNLGHAINIFTNDCGPSTKFLLGWHVVTSGLLYQITSQAGVENRFFVGGGLDVNLYRLLDLSLSAGALIPTRDNGEHPSFAGFLGLQLPLPDYIQELTSGSGSASQGGN